MKITKAIILALVTTSVLITSVLADTNIVFVHGLNSGSSTWKTMASNVSNMLGGQGKYVEIAIYHQISPNATCWRNGAYIKKVPCSELSSDIDSLPSYRRSVPIGSDRIFGLDKGQFSISKIGWKLTPTTVEFSNSRDKSATMSQHRVFAINFSHHKELTYDAQGLQLKAVMDDIANITKVRDFILIGHSMGGLASRAYIQNEKFFTNHTVKALITLNTPHLGSPWGGIRFESSASTNLAPHSLAIKQLNSSNNISGKYRNIDVYHLGYSDDLQDVYGEDYYSETDGIVGIGSQMGLDELNPHRVIFSSEVEDTTAYEKQDGSIAYADEVIQSDNYSNNFSESHSGLLNDSASNQYMLDLLVELLYSASTFHGAGSLVEPSNDCFGCNKDIAVMHKTNTPSTVVFQWLQSDDRCSFLKLEANKLGMALISSKNWSSTSVDKTYFVSFPVTIPNSGTWTTTAITSIVPLTTDKISVYAYCSPKDSDAENRQQTPSSVDVIFANGYTWAGNGSIISKDSTCSSFGCRYDVAAYHTNGNSLTAFQWQVNSDCRELKIKRQAGGNFNAKLKYKGWHSNEWYVDKFVTFPYSITSTQDGAYYVITVEASTGAIQESSRIEAVCQ